MLKALYKPTNKTFVSWRDFEIIKRLDKKEFVCSDCKEEVIFVDGKLIRKHFRHKVESNCDPEPETQEHINMKMFIQQIYNLSDDEIEVNLGFAKPDCLLKDYNGNKVAIEVQHSNITQEQFINRCYNYSKNGYYVLWIFDESLIKGDRICALLREAHKIYKDRVYIFKDNKIQIYHFENPKYYSYKRIIYKYDKLNCYLLKFHKFNDILLAKFLVINFWDYYDMRKEKNNFQFYKLVVKSWYL